MSPPPGFSPGFGLSPSPGVVPGLSGFPPSPGLPGSVVTFSQTAVTVVSLSTVISSPAAYSVSPIFQPLNFFLSGAVKPLADKVYFEPFSSFAPSIVPEPSPGS